MFFPGFTTTPSVSLPGPESPPVRGGVMCGLVLRFHLWYFHSFIITIDRSSYCIEYYATLIFYFKICIFVVITHVYNISFNPGRKLAKWKKTPGQTDKGLFVTHVIRYTQSVDLKYRYEMSIYFKTYPC